MLCHLERPTHPLAPPAPDSTNSTGNSGRTRTGEQYARKDDRGGASLDGRAAVTARSLGAEMPIKQEASAIELHASIDSLRGIGEAKFSILTGDCVYIVISAQRPAVGFRRRHLPINGRPHGNRTSFIQPPSLTDVITQPPPICSYVKRAGGGNKGRSLFLKYVFFGGATWAPNARILIIAFTPWTQSMCSRNMV